MSEAEGSLSRHVGIGMTNYRAVYGNARNALAEQQKAPQGYLLSSIISIQCNFW